MPDRGRRWLATVVLPVLLVLLVLMIAALWVRLQARRPHPPEPLGARAHDAPTQGTIELRLSGPSAESESVRLRVLDGSKVLVTSEAAADGSSVEVPLDLELTVKVGSSRHLTRVQQVRLTAEEPRRVLRFELELAPRLVIRTQPGAQVWLDGRKIGRADSKGRLQVTLEQAGGKHQVKAAKEGFRSSAVSFTAKPGEAPLRLALVELPQPNQDPAYGDGGDTRPDGGWVSPPAMAPPAPRNTPPHDP